jgi:predicted alpha/beta hydrolase
MSTTVSKGAKCVIDAEGAQLVGRFFAAQGETVANLVLHGATGVPQRFYMPFARWASARGFGVLIYDYRDFGESAHRHVRESHATLADWAVRDQSAAEQKLAELAPEGPLWVLGHSLGGLSFTLYPHDPRVERITTVGAGLGHFTDHPLSYLPSALAFWYLLGPIGTALCGYLPGKTLLLGADLPAGVYWQWRRWCTDRRFFRVDVGKTLPEPDFGAEGPALRMLSMTDDLLAPPVVVTRYADAFPKGRVEHVMLEPQAFGLSSLGHLEVFSERNAAAWPTILNLCSSNP